MTHHEAPDVPPALVDVPADHLDLIATAAGDFGLLSGSPATAAGQLAEQLLAAGQHAPAGYVFRPVTAPLDPLEVIKACQTYRGWTTPTRTPCSRPAWNGGRSEQLVDRVIAEGLRRVPGYADVPAIWTRGPERTAPPVGFCGAWTPPVHVYWLADVDQLRARWDSASHVLITLQAIAAVPDDLPARPEVYMLCGEHIPAAAWGQLETSPAATVIMLPAGLSWIRERVERDPR